MSDEPTERDVEALADSIAVCFSNVSDLPEWMQVPALGRDMRPLTLIAARAVLRSDGYAERIAEARREGAANELDKVADSLAIEDHHCFKAGCPHCSRPKTLVAVRDRLRARAAALRGDA